MQFALCRIALLYFYQPAPLRGAGSGAPPRRPTSDRSMIQQAHSSRSPAQQAAVLPSLPIVQLAATASRCASGRRERDRLGQPLTGTRSQGSRRLREGQQARTPRHMLRSAACSGSTVVEVMASHSVYVSQPAAAADLIKQAVSAVAAQQ